MVWTLSTFYMEIDLKLTPSSNQGAIQWFHGSIGEYFFDWLISIWGSSAIEARNYFKRRYQSRKVYRKVD